MSKSSNWDYHFIKKVFSEVTNQAWLDHIFFAVWLLFEATPCWPLERVQAEAVSILYIQSMMWLDLGCTTASNLLSTHQFVADSWTLADIHGSGCLGNPLAYLPPYIYQGMLHSLLLVVFSIEALKCYLWNRALWAVCSFFSLSRLNLPDVVYFLHLFTVVKHFINTRKAFLFTQAKVSRCWFVLLCVFPAL